MTTLPALLTPRDTEILLALDRCPLTVRQLHKLSGAYAQPFGSERRVRQRMQILAESGFVRRWRYAAIGQGTLNYYTLSPTGFQLLYGADEPLPHAKAFGPVGLSRLAHTQALADFVVHTAVIASRGGIRLEGYCRENAVRLTVGTESLYPDGAFQLLTADDDAFSFFIEVDNATERLRSDRSLDTWERKLRLYEAYQDQCPKRFRLLIATTGTEARVQNILALAARLARNPTRSLSYGITLAAYLRADAIVAPAFLNHRLRPVALVPRPQMHSPVVAPFLSSLPAVTASCA